MSKNSRNYLLYLEDIINAIEKIENYTQNMDFHKFSKNEMVIDAVIRNFEVIGEATRNIPEDVKERYPKVEWKEATPPPHPNPLPPRGEGSRTSPTLLDTWISL